MPWIKIQTNLPDDPAVSSIATRLRMTEQHVVGCLVAVWSWADALTADGFVQYATPGQIDKKAGKKGFAEAMTCVGWLRIEPAGLLFPKWDRHNGESAKARAGEAEAKRLARSGIRRSGPATLSTQFPTEMSGHLSGQASRQNADKCPDQRREEERREEERREEERIQTNPQSPLAGGREGDCPDNAERLNESHPTSPPDQPAPSPDNGSDLALEHSAPPRPTPAPTSFPPSLDTLAFQSAWADWLAYRRENKLPTWKVRTLTAKLAELAAWGEPTAIVSIRQSIANGWHGLFEPKGNHAANRKPSTFQSTYELEKKAHGYTI